MTYRIELHREARKTLEALPEKVRRLVAKKIDQLAHDPRPQGCKVVRGARAEYHRVRSGDYRVVYQVEDDVLRVLVIKVGHRRNVYRNLGRW